MRLWREHGCWRLRTYRSTYYGRLCPALLYGLRSWGMSDGGHER